MGTKRPSCTIFDTSSNINMSDRKLQPGGKISRDPSPRPAMTAQLERDRDGNRDEDRRRETDVGKNRDKARYKDTEPRERHRERVPASTLREGERDWRERERRQEDDRSGNGRTMSNVDRGMLREMERVMKKGDTFPKMRQSSKERDRRMMSNTEIDDEIRESRQRDRPRRMEIDERKWQRERYGERERDGVRSRAKEEGKRGVARPVKDEDLRKRDRYQESDGGFQDRGREAGDSWDRRERERDTARKGDKSRPNMSDREAQRDRDFYSNRKEREAAQRREGKRDTRSEGDSDERELRKEKVRDREGEELIYQHSRSEGENTGRRLRDRDGNRQRSREGDRPRDRDRERDGDTSKRRGVEKDRERDREEDRSRRREKDPVRSRDRGWTNERRDDDRYREYEQRDKERRERGANSRGDDTKGRSSRSPSNMTSRAPPRSQSSGEWSSDMDSETRYRRGRDSYEERESGRESTAESERDAEESRDPRRAAERERQSEQIRNERKEKGRGQITGSVPEQRRMWLEPQRGKNSEEDFANRERHTRQKERRREEEGSMVSQAERGREVQQVKEEPDERYADYSSYRKRHAGRNEYGTDMDKETEGLSVDGDEAWRETDKGGTDYLSDSSSGMERGWQRDTEGENTDNTEESGREEEGGTNYLACSEKGSETVRKQERDSMLSVEDGFVTVSSGGDEDDDREEEFEDCKEFWQGGSSPVGCKGRDGDKERPEGRTVGQEEDQGREKQPKYVFCVIGQTLPRSRAGDKSLSQFDQMGGDERNESHFQMCHNYSNDIAQHPQDDQRSTVRGNDDYLINNQDTEGRSELKDKTLDTSKTTEEDMRYRSSSEPQDPEAGEEIKRKVENPYDEIGPFISKDAQTERLLIQWREKNKDRTGKETTDLSGVPGNRDSNVFSQADFEKLQPILDGIKTGVMSPEEVEAIRIRLSGAWSMSEEPKRHSQAPHLKWAKDVVREILGQSEEFIEDETNAKDGGEQMVDRPEMVMKEDKWHEEVSEPELEEGEPLELEGLRGMGQSQADMHAEQFIAMHGDTTTHTHADTLLDSEAKEEHTLDKETEPSSPLQLETAHVEVHVSQEGGGEATASDDEIEEGSEEEMKMFLSVSNTLYKPNSCPILNYETESDLLAPSREGNSQEEEDDSEEEGQEGESEEGDTVGEVGKVSAGEENAVDSREGEEVAEKKIGGTLKSTCSFRDLGPTARIRRRGIRKTTERRNAELLEEEEDEGVGRDRRTRIFSTTDDEDDRSKSWGEVELRNVLDTIDRRKRNSKFFNAAQLYQQYSEAAQNFEILRQARSDVLSVCEDNVPSPAPSPPPARRPLPPLPPVPHPHSLSHTGSVTSVKSLPLPEPPKSEGRPSSPRLSVSLTQSATLWRDLPGVRNSGQLEELTEDQRRLQEVRFEVLTSEASYCRSLDIVVEHFVKSKQLGALLTTQDRNWLFSRLADVRAISHSFLSKLEERMESNIVHFTVCDIIARHCQRFKMVYVPYLTNQSYQDATYQRLMNENPGFRRIVEKLERSPVCQRLPLRSFLVLPFQRITRIKLLVQNIVKRTTPGTAEATQAIKALKLLEKLIQESNDSISQMKSIESLVCLSAKVDFECRTLPLISQSRRLVREGAVTELMDFSLKDTERNIYMHLFNDYLLISLQKEGGKFTVIDHSPVSELRVENCRVKLHSLQKNLFRLHIPSHKSLLLRTDTLSDKLRWISAISRPHPEIDFSAAQDFPQMQCIRAFVGQQPDELSLEKADIILVHQQSSDHWVEGTRLSDRQRGWVPESHLEIISNSRVRQRNLSDALKLTTATAAV
ncbi:trichohyalin-like isoform X1 [Solea senegalensis]|nr:trichohyalin isoform X1 [Solea senegalensis]KAG7474368.1 trichohyalin-like isoform X1 [Solea senegalensis]